MWSIKPIPKLYLCSLTPSCSLSQYLSFAPNLTLHSSNPFHQFGSITTPHSSLVPPASGSPSFHFSHSATVLLKHLIPPLQYWPHSSLGFTPLQTSQFLQLLSLSSSKSKVSSGTCLDHTHPTPLLLWFSKQTTITSYAPNAAMKINLL